MIEKTGKVIISDGPTLVTEFIFDGSLSMGSEGIAALEWALEKITLDLKQAKEDYDSRGFQTPTHCDH